MGLRPQRTSPRRAGHSGGLEGHHWARSAEPSRSPGVGWDTEDSLDTHLRCTDTKEPNSCSYSKPVILDFGVLSTGTLVTEQQQDPGHYSEQHSVWGQRQGPGRGGTGGGGGHGAEKRRQPPVRRY